MPRGASVPDADNNFDALEQQLRGMSGLDPADRTALLDDLKKSDPSLWPQLVRQFRAALAYRNRKEAAREPTSVAAAVPGSDGADPKTENPPEPAKLELNIAANVGRSPTVPIPEVKAVSPKAEKSDKSSERTSAAKVQLASAASRVDKAEPPAKLPASSAKTSGSPAPGLDDWQLQLTKTILALEGGGSNSADAAEINQQIQLRLLYLAAGRRDDALKPIAGLSAAQQEFWTKELFGLSAYLDSGRVADPERRATEAAHHLREAAGRIGELANPVVRNLAFCKEVTSFGVYKKFPKYEFKAGDEVLLYSEIENLKAESTDRGFHTSVKSSYQILDSRGERVAEQEFPVSDDFCGNPRRDFFIPYFIWFPKHINDGTYMLQLTVEDVQTKKIAQSSIQFTVK